MLVGASETGATGIAEAGVAANPGSAIAAVRNTFLICSPFEKGFRHGDSPPEHLLNGGSTPASFSARIRAQALR
jgi:hypothetical protein